MKAGKEYEGWKRSLKYGHPSDLKILPQGLPNTDKGKKRRGETKEGSGGPYTTKSSRSSIWKTTFSKRKKQGKTPVPLRRVLSEGGEKT